MQRYFIELSFNGSRYHGWQLQPNGLTVQEVLESTFTTFLRRKVEVTGAGRTDAGVHASFFVAHFDIDTLPMPVSDLVEKLNRFLPSDIALHRIRPVAEGMHARYSALSRTYRYIISRAKDPFTLDTSYPYYLPLDTAEMNRAAAMLSRYSDFTSFARLHSAAKNNLCNITQADWTEEGNKLVFTITANRFLRNMVRAITGTLIEVGRGRITPEEFAGIIEKQDRGAAGASVPPQGLFLAAIEYPESCNPGS